MAVADMDRFPPKSWARVFPLLPLLPVLECNRRLATVNFGVEPVPSSSSTSILWRFSTTRREGVGPPVPLLECDIEASDPDNG